jgi:hypothetical protein
VQEQGWIPKALVVLLVLVSAGLCAAQDVRWGRPPVPSSGACFYKETDFRGDYFCVRNGQSYSNLPPGFNDRIYSLRVFGRTPVSVYVDNNYRGAQATTRRNIRDLRNCARLREAPGEVDCHRFASVPEAPAGVVADNQRAPVSSANETFAGSRSA